MNMSSIRSVRRLAAVLTAMVALLAAGLLTATPASAVGYSCDSVVAASDGSHPQPTYDRRTYACYMSSTRGEPVAIKRLQAALAICYDQDDLVIDGVYGPKTAAALKVAQRKLKVDDDGLYGPETAVRILFPLFPWLVKGQACL
ncbi:peptidoglycan-binding domain-containing protein [Luteimicrobium subarcticum]|uniref:Putative peptidoglycan binding protein n=1 Tax=Luteimicrobium subarcticum TaxID=620910 RepID=A0A2M8W3W5_9MICO|nr:peptidoglycan-binding domain-containing protein [Luteimicrobium subarcticum]PJI85626.1 putative peptidoglycan binding protein [Luteimicrobium subarcticum]